MRICLVSAYLRLSSLCIEGFSVCYWWGGSVGLLLAIGGLGASSNAVMLRIDL